MSSARLKLIATPLSFALCQKSSDLVGFVCYSYQFCDIVGNTALTKKPSEVGGHPLMKVPVLQHSTEWLVESDHIAQYLCVNLIQSTSTMSCGQRFSI